jgi:hypothetical protein
MTQQLQVLSPIPVIEPHGARWAGHAAVWLGQTVLRAGRALWRGLEAQGRSRAAKELMAAAQRWEDRDPSRAQTLRAASRALSSAPITNPDSK